MRCANTPARVSVWRVAALLSVLSVGALWLLDGNDSVIHLTQWHYLPMLAVDLIGLWLDRALLKW